VTIPATSERNFRPSSTELVSLSSNPAGLAEALQMVSGVEEPEAVVNDHT
jgi:hypothetical protein